jgi:thiamine pyrophosphate-dependent acetolactate synthase large subunit-like protein
VQWIQRRDLDGRIVATQFDPALDVVAAARACGCDGVRVGAADELGPALERARRANAEGVPFVVDVPVDQAHHHAEFDAFHGFAPAAGSATA